MLWSSLIVLGTFLRGPNWNFFGPFEFWDIHKLAALTNVNLSEYIWVRGAANRRCRRNWLVREIFGILLVLFYVFALPVILAKRLVQGLLRQAGRAARTTSRVFLFLMMMSLPIKMLAAMDLQPEVHRGDPRDSSSTSEPWLKRRASGTLTTSTS